jgi:TAG lipase/lysophosphatidylethanolamine acyltransferase
MGIYADVHLLAKDQKNDIVPWNMSKIIFNDSNKEEFESANLKLSELFNVNHFIISQTIWHFAPFWSSRPQRSSSFGILRRFNSFLGLEFRHRIFQIYKLLALCGQVVPYLRKVLPFVDMFIYHNMPNAIEINPNVDQQDFFTLFSNPTYATLKYWMEKGEKATWPYLTLIKSRTSVERALEANMNLVKKMMEEERDQLKRERSERQSRKSFSRKPGRKPTQ